jgi:hypothetical protein
MKRISMTLLGIAAVSVPVIIAALAQSEDRAVATKQCAAEICTANTGHAARRRVASLQQAKNAQKILNEKSKSVQGIKTIESLESGQSNRISCGAGRSIVAKRFNRVRVIECKGGTYTYIGRRNGASFKVLVDGRTGRVVGQAPI